MIVFFIIVSFIFHLIAFFAIVLIVLRQNKLLQVEKEQKKVIEQLEEVIDSYLIEMKDENERFIAKLKLMQHEKEKPDTVYTSSREEAVIETDEQQTENTSLPTVKKEEHESHALALDFTDKLEKAVSLQAMKAYQSHAVKKNENVNSLESEERKKEKKKESSQQEKETAPQDSLLSQLLRMKKAGLSAEEMAQKLKKGKTEIELLLKFHAKQ